MEKKTTSGIKFKGDQLDHLIDGSLPWVLTPGIKIVSEVFSELQGG